MNVTRTNHDEVSALLTVTLNKSDYKDKVEKTLINYAKNATVPGFRKGKVPLSMVKQLRYRKQSKTSWATSTCTNE